MFNCKISGWLQTFITLKYILSQKWVLLGSNIFIFASISFSVTWKKLILLPVLYEKDGEKLVYIYARSYWKCLFFHESLSQTYHGQVLLGFDAD